jgi:hypothetical protein
VRDVKARLGSTGRMMAQLLDQFGVYPTDMETVRSLPEGWWSPPASPRTRDRAFEVIDMDAAGD